MKTDDLIDVLSREPASAPEPAATTRVAIAAATGLAIAAAIVVLGLGVRHDIGAARMPVMLKATFSALAASAVLPLLLRLARPGQPLGWRVGAAVGFFALALTVGLIALAGAAPSHRFAVWMGGTFPWCVAIVPLLAAPIAALLAWVLRDLAPTRLAVSGAALGAVSGGIGAMAYAMYCPVDSVAFVTTWYSVAIGLCAALGALLGARLLRW